MQRDGHVRTQGEDDVHTPREEAPGRPALPTPGSQPPAPGLGGNEHLLFKLPGQWCCGGLSKGIHLASGRAAQAGAPTTRPLCPSSQPAEGSGENRVPAVPPRRKRTQIRLQDQSSMGLTSQVPKTSQVRFLTLGFQRMTGSQ